MTANKKGRATAAPKDFFNPNSTTNPLIAYVLHVSRAKHGGKKCRSSRKQAGSIDPLLFTHLLVLAVFLFLIVGGAA